MNRREFIKLSSLGIGGGALMSSFPLWSSLNKPDIRLVASESSHTFVPNQKVPTQVLSYNGSIPGPVLRVQQGVETSILFENQMEESSSIHWHGLRIDNAMDGVPGKTQEVVNQGGQFTYRFTPPDAGTYWYHTHQRSWEQLAKGLAGILIVEEPNPPKVDQDLVFAIDDWRINGSMQIDEESLGDLHAWAHGGRMGNFVSVNGLANKAYSVSKGERIRFRLINIANSRIMTLRFNLPTISVIAIDGQPVTPYSLEKGVLTLAPGQRIDLMIDMVLDPNHKSPIELLIEDKAHQVAYFKFSDKVKREQLLDNPIALPLNPVNRVAIPEKAISVPLLMEGGAMGSMQEAIYQGRKMTINELVQHQKIWAFNGVAGLPEKPLFQVNQGTAIGLAVVNNNAFPHGIHIHGHHFIHDKEPSYWRDTALFSRGEKGRIKFVADNPGKWLIHCHMIEHQAGGMVTWFEVV